MTSRRTLLGVVGLAALIVAIVMTGVWWFDSRPAPYDEAAHRAAIERLYGHPVANWDDYLANVRDICDDDDNRFGLTVAVFADGGELPSMRVNVAHVCPDRQQLLDDTIREGSKDPCANPITDADKRRAEAFNCPS